MGQRHLFHGAVGEKILDIIDRGAIRPNQAGEIYFSENHPEWVFSFGADQDRAASFVVKLELDLPPGIRQWRGVRTCVLDTLMVVTVQPVPAHVLELYVRRLGEWGAQLETIVGEDAIREYLRG